MSTDIPSQISFENMLAYMFPGFFASLSLFMAIDILSPFNLTNYVTLDLTTLISFYGILLLGGTIIGVIIDGIHHRFIEQVYFHIIEDCMSIKRGDSAKYHRTRLKCDEKPHGKSCDSCKFKDSKIEDGTEIYFLFDINEIENCIKLREYLTKSVYHYSEFYANTFIALIPFAFVAPIYMIKELHIDYWISLIGGCIMISLAILCLDFAWMAYERWISALYFAYCRCPPDNPPPVNPNSAGGQNA